MTIRPLSLLLASALLHVATTNVARAQLPAGYAASEIGKLSWLAGCWEQRAPGHLVQEHWMDPAGGTMIGMSRTLARDATRDATRGWEYLRIAAREGRLTYTAAPSGQAETPFLATVLSDTLAVFENPEHDFPQRISYRKLSSDSVMARISATRGGKTQGMDIPMSRSRCGGV